jgi:diguanylate cyclase (GGDEF)-like protein
MNNGHRNGHGPERANLERGEAKVDAAQRTRNADQTTADADQSAADADQTHADSDQTASAIDQTSADRDQRASDEDQAISDRERAARPDLGGGDANAYDATRDQRDTGTSERLGNRLKRANTARERDATASERDRNAEARDEAARGRDLRTADIAATAGPTNGSLIQQLEELGAEAATDRARAATDRARAAGDRENAARERSRLESELHAAHLDQLTGAYGRELGQTALAHEISRARRGDGRFVLAFVDVDGLKSVNDRDGHAAGDQVLQNVVAQIRTRLRSFDPIIRWGGDEFVCGLSGTDLVQAASRFDTIGTAIEADVPSVTISVGLAALVKGESGAGLTERADAAMLLVKADHHSRP